jgi:DNA-directed RNA polymerase specialized sigma24 family protein
MTLIARSVEGIDDGSALVDNLQRSEASRLVQRFIDELTADLREIFLLCCVEGLPGSDVARLLNLNINTLYSRERTARRRFQAFIQNIHTLEERRP